MWIFVLFLYTHKIDNFIQKLFSFIIIIILLILFYKKFYKINTNKNTFIMKVRIYTNITFW